MFLVRDLQFGVRIMCGNSRTCWPEFVTLTKSAYLGEREKFATKLRLATRAGCPKVFAALEAARKKCVDARENASVPILMVGARGLEPRTSCV